GLGDFFTVLIHGIMRARWRGGALHLEWDEAALHALGFLLRESLAPNKRGLFQIDKNAQARLERRGIEAEIGAVERVTHFQDPRVACAQAARHDAELFPASEDVAPTLHGAVGGAENLETVLARVAGTRDEIAETVDLDGEDFIASGPPVLPLEEGVEELRGT